MKGALKFVCASAVALALALDGFGAWKGLGGRSRRDSGDAPRSSAASFAPAIDRRAIFAVAAGVDREKLWGLADSFLDRLIAASGTGGEPIRHLKANLLEYKKNPFKDLPTDDEVMAFLRESGVLDADFRWAVVSMDEMPDKDGEDSIPEGASLVVAGDVDIEKFLRVTQRKLAEDVETASRFAEMTLEGERVWHLVPTSETSAREMKEAGIDFYVAWLDRQLAIVTISRDVMARQLRLYRRGEGKIGAMRGDDVYDADAYFFVSGIGNAVREFASSKDLEDWKAIPNGEEVCRGLKTLEAKLKAGAGGSVSLSVRVSAASRHDADVLRTVAGLAFVGARSKLVETFGDKGKALANILESVKVGGADDVIEISLNTSVSDLATALCPFIAEAMDDAKTESAKGREEPTGASLEPADVCANEILDRMGPCTWLITEGVLDANLREAAAARGQELNIITIKDRDEQQNKAYCNWLADQIEKKGLSAGKKTSDDLAFTLRELGLLTFLKTWFGNDPDIMNKVRTVGWPDFWFWAHCRPVPDCLVFRGVKDEKTVDGLKVKADFEAFWQKIEPRLEIDRYRGKGSRSLHEIESMADRYRLNLRRHLGLIANNIGVLLQNLGHDKEAFEMYELVLGTIDCDNVCALFNEFEMACANKAVAQARKREIEQQFKELVADNSRRYYIEMLSVAYGYIRSPTYFIQRGVQWAKAGGMGYLLENLKYASDLVPGGAPKELLNMMAGLYAEGGQKELSRETYLKVLEKDAANYDALMGLWKLSIMDGATDEARLYLKKAEKAKTRDGVVRLEVPLQYLMDNNLDEAHEALTQIGRLQPSVRIWALDAGVMLMLADKAKNSTEKQRILTEVENGILPKMEQLSDSPRDFHVQMTRALVLMRKGSDPETVKQARAALEVAWQSRPTVAVGGMVLDMDVRLQDHESAERHALKILRMDVNHSFANWVMGSIRMGEEKLVEAERYMRASAGGKHPYAPAQNDLADILRRRGSLVEAEEFARAATKTAPDLYIVWETLASTLLDRGKNLDEAESCIQKALEFPAGKADLRMQLTLARVQIAKKDFVSARKTLRALDKRRDKLTSDHDKSTLDELIKQAKGK